MSRRKALVIGIDDYPGNRLDSCSKDAAAISELLKKNEDGTPNFETLSPCIYNKGELKDYIERLFLGDNEISLLYFAGHGASDNEGGHLVTPDFTESNPGVTMSYVTDCMAKSNSRNKIAILDCCYAGIIGNSAIAADTCILKEGITILSGCNREESSAEDSDHGIFTNLLIDGLKGGAADLSGSITPGSLYAYVDKSLGAWDQRPVFKTNISNFICLRKVKPPVDRTTLIEIVKLFEKSNAELRLDPSFEFTNHPEYRNKATEPYSNEKNVERFKVLQKLVNVGLVAPVNEDHMYFAAMNSGKCKLTSLGRYYWSLVQKGRI